MEDDTKDFTTITGHVITKETFDKYYRTKRANHAKKKNMPANFRKGSAITGLPLELYGLIYMNYTKLHKEFYGDEEEQC